MRVLVYGLGRSGVAAARLAASQGHALEVFDARSEADLATAEAELGAERLNDVTSSRAELCIAAPGVRIDHPDLDALRRRGVEVIGEVEWVYRTVPTAAMVGITGTAGKGTVTRWIADTLAGAGRDTVAGGNLDPALCAVARPGATHVVELSSFQLERCPRLRLDVAVALNLGEDHIDRHGSVDAYHAVKRNLIANQRPDDHFVFNADDAKLRTWAEGATAATHAFSLEREADARFDRDSGRLMLEGRALLHANELQVRGEHQVANALAVALACRALGLEPDAIARGLRAFRGLPGRYAPAGTIGDVHFIEDSIATRPLAVAAALRATPAPMVWLAGGRAKGASVDDLAALVRERVDLLVAFGESGPDFARAFGAVVPTRVCDAVDGREAMRCAVLAALEHLRTHHGGRGQVLLAPLAASFDQFRDYAERARVFREVVAAVREERTWTASC